MSNTIAQALEAIKEFDIPTHSAGKAIAALKEKYAGQDALVYVEMVKTITGYSKYIVTDLSDYHVWVALQYVVQHYVTATQDFDADHIITECTKKASEFIAKFPYMSGTTEVTNEDGTTSQVSKQPKATVSVKERAIAQYNALNDKSREAVMTMLATLGLEKNTANAYYSRLKRGVWA